MPRIIAEHIDQYREENGIVKCYKVCELIRCEDCKHCETMTIFGKTTLYSCTRKNPAVDVLPSDYCSRAERKEE